MTRPEGRALAGSLTADNAAGLKYDESAIRNVRRDGRPHAEDEVGRLFESAHAIRVAIDEALKCKVTGEKKVIAFNLSGHGHFDTPALAFRCKCDGLRSLSPRPTRRLRVPGRGHRRGDAALAAGPGAVAVRSQSAHFEKTAAPPTSPVSGAAISETAGEITILP